MQHCDVAILICLEEEFKEFDRLTGKKKDDDADPKSGRHFFLFEWPPVASIPYRCVTTFVGSMGAQDAGQFAREILDRYSPSTFVIVGLAGSLSGDVLIGDVIVADQIDDYLQDGRVGEDGLAPSGRSYRPHIRLRNEVQYFPYAHKDAWDAVVVQSRSDLSALLRNQQPSKAVSELVRDGTKVHIGHLASGPLVGASASYKKWLKRLDRKYLAIEMETAGVMNAIYHSAGDERALVIRGISDTSNELKTYTDQVNGGELRGFAMRSASRLLLAMLDKDLIRRKDEAGEPDPSGPDPEESDPHKFRIFLSSTLGFIEEEHRAVEEVISQHGHKCIDSRYFGNYPRTLFHNRTEALRSTDLLIAVVRPDIHLQRGGALLTSFWDELKEAEAYGIGVLVYERKSKNGAFDADGAELAKVRRTLSDRLSDFTHIRKLRQKLARDLERMQSNPGARLIQEGSLELLDRHLRVLTALERNSLQKAQELNEGILHEYPFSPRALYNSACIYSRMASAESKSEKRTLLVTTARHKLSDAIAYGILKFIRLAKGYSDRDSAVGVIVNDTDLTALFDAYPELPAMLKNGRPIGFPASSGGGCACGCDFAALRDGDKPTQLQESWARVAARLAI